MTAKEVVQSWSRPQLESAFTQREAQLEEALRERDGITIQRDALLKQVGAYTQFINANSHLADIGRSILSLDFRKLSRQELTTIHANVACAGGH